MWSDQGCLKFFMMNIERNKKKFRHSRFLYCICLMDKGIKEHANPIVKYLPKMGYIVQCKLKYCWQNIIKSNMVTIKNQHNMKINRYILIQHDKKKLLLSYTKKFPTKERLLFSRSTKCWCIDRLNSTLWLRKSDCPESPSWLSCLRQN